MLSNALCAAAAQPAGRPDLMIPAPMRGPLAAGICALVVWSIVRAARPRKLLLRRVPGRPNHLNPLHLLAVYAIQWIAMFLASSVLLAAMGIEVGLQATPPVKVSILTTIFGQWVMAGASLALAATTFRHGLQRGFGLSARRFLVDSGRAVIGFLVVLPLCVAALILTAMLIEPTEHPLLKFLETASPAWKATAILSAVVLAPVAEEVFFRGLVQSMLRRYFRSPWLAVLLTSAAFAMVHWGQFQDWPALFLLAVALGYNYERTGRLLAPILLHAIFNGVMIWVKLASQSAPTGIGAG